MVSIFTFPTFFCTFSSYIKMLTEVSIHWLSKIRKIVGPTGIIESQRRKKKKKKRKEEKLEMKSMTRNCLNNMDKGMPTYTQK